MLKIWFFQKNYLTLSQNSHLWVKNFWQKYLSKKSASVIYPVQKILDNFFQSSFSISEVGNWPFFRTPQIKKSIKWVQKGTPKCFEKNVGMLKPSKRVLQNVFDHIMKIENNAEKNRRKWMQTKPDFESCTCFKFSK